MKRAQTQGHRHDFSTKQSPRKRKHGEPGSLCFSLKNIVRDLLEVNADSSSLQLVCINNEGLHLLSHIQGT